ncbi:TetR/AcrR family transcriptional regulator [Streptantibioticus silvisoli]|uniref:TetR/AcrR family transcriptional regulator n=1 Tax=Streptantibioticus silvisoli TaxID=2705255 RepID=A0ABT6W3J8_9ACTN|nr:TetR/AcrR family transcriptional regulator [Streptantibioticus silvisoli]MDI5964879.1 TetR/AcrR family transcriptional regulator [Streptantibioticus silvisoli]
MERVLTERGRATRDRIVEGAARLLRERGVPNVGLDDIRAATATSKSQLFHYFPDGKSDLLLAVAEYEAAEVIADQQPMLGDLVDLATWHAWRDRVVERYAAQGDRCPLTALTAQLGLADPATRTIITRMYDRWQSHLADGVRALTAAGAIPPGADPDRSATAILTAICGGATMLQATNRITYLEVALDDALSTLGVGRG